MSALAPIGKGYRRILIGGAIVCTAAALVGQFRFGSSLYLYKDLKNEAGAFEGSMTVVSAFLMVVAAVYSFRCSEVLRRRDARTARGFAGFAALLVFLAMDELVMFHEWVASKLEAHGVWKPLGIDQDAYVFAVYGVIGAWTLFLMRGPLLRHRAAATLLVGMVACAVGSEAVDFVPWEPLSATQKTWLGPLEEGLKTMATLFGALYAHALLGAVEREVPGNATLS
jgi:hypothetical protein